MEISNLWVPPEIINIINNYSEFRETFKEPKYKIIIFMPPRMCPRCGCYQIKCSCLDAIKYKYHDNMSLMDFILYYEK